MVFKKKKEEPPMTAEQLKKVEEESLAEVDELIEEMVEAIKDSDSNIKHYATWEDGLVDFAEALAAKKERGEIESSKEVDANEW